MRARHAFVKFGREREERWLRRPESPQPLIGQTDVEKRVWLIFPVPGRLAGDSGDIGVFAGGRCAEKRPRGPVVLDLKDEMAHEAAFVAVQDVALNVFAD